MERATFSLQNNYDSFTYIRVAVIFMRLCDPRSNEREPAKYSQHVLIFRINPYCSNCTFERVRRGERPSTSNLNHDYWLDYRCLDNCSPAKSTNGSRQIKGAEQKTKRENKGGKTT